MWATPPSDCLCPHAASSALELRERGLDSGVEHGVGLAVKQEAPRERLHPEPARAIGSEDRHLRAGARVVDGIGGFDVAYGVCTAFASRVKHRPRLHRRERAEPHAHVRLLSSSPIIPRLLVTPK